jgi:hypothetical protein
MNSLDYIDLASKAKELGVTEATLKARAMSGDELCYIHVVQCMAWSVSEKWLPAHDPERFPMVRWIDHGSEYRSREDFTRRSEYPPSRTPWYHLSGWVVLEPDHAAKVLTQGEAKLNLAYVGVFDSNDEFVCELQLHVPDRIEWVAANVDEYSSGGYERKFPIKVTSSDLFMIANQNASSRTLLPRKEQSYLGIISGLRALLRHKEFGGLPSDAKIIDQLIERYKHVDGISKRKLEDVFADATRTVGSLEVKK